MTVYILDKQLFFASVPKVACTSIKEALFEVENGFSFRQYYANGVLRHIHDPSIYPARPFSSVPHDVIKNCLKLAMVRHPIKRFLSAYSNRVLFYKELSEEHIGERAKDLCVPTNPTLSEFVEHLHEYRSISNSIRLHTEGMHHFLGADPLYYDEIFDISDIQSFSSLVSKHLGTDFKVPHLQTGGPKIPVEDLTAQQIDFLVDFYKNDYKIYEKYWR